MAKIDWSKIWHIFTIFMGAQVAAQALHYFITPAVYTSSNLRTGLVVIQFVFGVAIAVLGFKNLKTLKSVF